MQYKKIINFILILLAIAAGFFCLPFLLNLFLPFLLSFVVAAISQRYIHFLEKKIKINRGISSALLITFIVALLCALLLFIILQIVLQIKNLLTALPSAIKALKIQIDILYNKYDHIRHSMSPETAAYIDETLSSMQESAGRTVSGLTDKIFGIAKSFAMALPNMVLFFITFLLSTFFFTKDYVSIVVWAKEHLPEKITKWIIAIKHLVFNVFLKYIKAQVILMTISFVIVTVSMWICRIDYPLTLGIICGIADVLPFVGTGIILVPAALIALIYGQIYKAGILIAIQATVFLVRQILEPRVVSSQIGLHPLLTLISVYIGLKLFGVVGVIIMPISALLLVNILSGISTKKM